MAPPRRVVMAARFIPGLELSRSFYAEAVRPVLDEELPGLGHSAALLGTGSEVLGYDSERSMDHDWGPRLLLFLAPGHALHRREEIADLLGKALPVRFRGFPTGFGPPDAEGSRMPDRAGHRPVPHQVEVHDVGRFFQRLIGFDPRAGAGIDDWLSAPSQALLEATSGAVFHDGLGELEAVRQQLGWYPHDLWLYLLASQWRRIAQEEPFVARCAESGDDLGARVAIARLVRDVMRLCFLFDRAYAPYGKWLGLAFARLPSAGALAPSLAAALDGPTLADRAGALNAALEAAGRLHNDLAICAPVDPTVRTFHRRPYLVLGADRFAEATRVAIQDERVRVLAPGVGGIDQWVDSADVLSRIRRARRTGLAVHGLDP